MRAEQNLRLVDRNVAMSARRAISPAVDLAVDVAGSPVS
jgi:hypothetical protein